MRAKDVINFEQALNQMTRSFDDALAFARRDFLSEELDGTEKEYTAETLRRLKKTVESMLSECEKAVAPRKDNYKWLEKRGGQWCMKSDLIER